MKIKKGFVIQEVAGQWVAVATGSAAKDFSGIVKLNATAAHVWKGLEQGQTREQIIAGMVEAYDIDEQTAGEDVDALLQRLVQAGIAEE
ncbi:MAG: PqqD family protein [Coriobacteriales bacterium]|nr:PqqD family protein [Coriobacteriales bacterium]